MLFAGDRPIQYRSEIDGLRAIAVLPVILFHAGIAGFGGGFVGVDIFFVISGYLITTILWSDLERGEFTFAKFYERRIRRILPAFVVVVACTLVAGWFWLPPDRFSDLGMSAASALFSVSNLYFYGEAGYFAHASETQPLLHTWSLGVEEQFYLVFPVLLLFLHRRMGRDQVMLVLAMIALASLAYCEWLWRRDPDANFFLIPSRTWELMAGSLCALFLFKRETSGNPLLAATGLALIALSILLLDKDTPFPSTLALLPVGGTVLVVLFARAENAVGRLLSWRPLVGIGLISYSAYLWHQPVLAFARLRLIESPSASMMLAMSLGTLGLAYLTWKYVEQPFRKPRDPARRAAGLTSVRAILASMLPIAMVSVAVNASGGAPDRFGEDRALDYEHSRQLSDGMRRCKTGYTNTDLLVCEDGERDRPALRIALIGDSHASQWTDALASEAEERGWALDTFAKSSCPIADVQFYLPALKRDYRECWEWRGKMRQAIEKGRYDLVIGTQSSLSYVRHHGQGSQTIAQWGSGMASFTQWADGLPGRWIVLSDNPQFRRKLPPECIAKTYLLDFGDPEICNEQRRIALDEGIRGIEQSLAAKSRKGSWIDLASLFCDEATCRPHIDGRLVMSDSNHLSVFGTSHAASSVTAEIERVVATGERPKLATYDPG